ncbi:MAG: hypothetical protein ABSG86_32180 [Thermoguttaceae bacterium]|jgi:hypothetical protein
MCTRKNCKESLGQYGDWVSVLDAAGQRGMKIACLWACSAVVALVSSVPTAP